jgi:multicomponent Na+:H+ antiporter subunit D
MDALLLGPVVVPLAGAVITIPSGRGRTGIALLSAAASAAAGVGLAAQVWRAGVVERRFAGPAGVEVVLSADGLAAALVLMTAALGLFASAFAAADAGRGPDRLHAAFWPLSLSLWAGTNGLFVAADLFTIYLLLELVAITGAALVVLGGDGRALVAGSRYFFAELAASATFLLGVALVWREAGTAVLSALPADLTATPAGRAGMAAMTVALLLKIPLFPLHFWLPRAHALAPSAVSPILSAVVVKTAFAVLVRLWFVALPGALGPGVAQLLGVLGVLAILWGSLNALRVAPVKLVIAHSTVAQLGCLLLLPPMVQAGSSAAWNGGVVQAIAHALAKGAALMAAAVFVRDAGGDAVADLGGTAARRPLATFAFGTASLSLVGLPPSGGFVAKWYLLLATFETGQWWWAPVIVVGSLLTAAYLMRIVKRAFAPATTGPVLAARDWREGVALLLALSALALGLRPVELLELLRIGAPLQAGG